MNCARCQLGRLDIWVSFRSVTTGQMTTLRYHDEEDARRGLRHAGVTKFEVLPYKECSCCHTKFTDVESLAAPASARRVV